MRDTIGRRKTLRRSTTPLKRWVRYQQTKSLTICSGMLRSKYIRNINHFARRMHIQLLSLNLSHASMMRRRLVLTMNRLYFNLLIYICHVISEQGGTVGCWITRRSRHSIEGKVAVSYSPKCEHTAKGEMSCWPTTMMWATS